MRCRIGYSQDEPPLTTHEPPRLTIVTAVLNRRDMLREAMESLGPADPAIEHLVVDGGSTDGTREVVLARPASRLIDAPGTGIYDAMDIGIRAAQGRFVGLLNSDDRYLPGALDRVRALAAAHPDADLISAGATLFDHDTGRTAPSGAAADRALAARQLILGAVDINARFFSRALYEAVGGFDLSYPCGADRHLLLKMARLDPRHVVVDEPIYQYRSHGGSFTFKPSRAKRIAMALEQADMVERALRERETPASWRAPLAGARAATEARLAVLEPRAALRRLPRLLRTDPWFPARLAAEVGAWLKRRVARATGDKGQP
jgi:glycosyltransferase involved in cell wall biosynthesis